VLHSPEYEGITTIADAAIVEIEQAQIFDTDGGGPRTLTPVTMLWLNNNQPTWASDDQANSAQYVFQLNPNAVSVYPKQAGTLQLKLVLQPSLTAETLPDWLYDVYRTEIGRGAAAKALMTPSDWQNPQLGTSLHSAFASKIATAKTEATKGQQGARLRTKGDWF
jgi:hypothetical protein